MRYTATTLQFASLYRYIGPNGSASTLPLVERARAQHLSARAIQFTLGATNTACINENIHTCSTAYVWPRAKDDLEKIAHVIVIRDHGFVMMGG